MGYMFDTNEKLFSTKYDVFLQDSRMTYGSFRIGLTAEMNPYERYLNEYEFRDRWDWKKKRFDVGVYPLIQEKAAQSR